MFYFQKNIIPVINYFRNKKILVEINGLGTVEEVYQQITKTLKTKAV